MSCFVVHVTHPVTDGWQKREKELEWRARRRWDSGASDEKTRELWWYCDDLDAARQLRDELKLCRGVTVVAREA